MTSKLTEAEEQYYDDLARKAERGELRPSGKQLRGREATEASQKLLMEATGTQTVDDATRVALGRPRLDEEEDRQPNVPWKLVAPHKLDASLEDARKPRGLNRSQYIRRAVTNQIRMDLGESSSDAGSLSTAETREALAEAIARAGGHSLSKLDESHNVGKMVARDQYRDLAEALLTDESITITAKTPAKKPARKRP